MRTQEIDVERARRLRAQGMIARILSAEANRKPASMPSQSVAPWLGFLRPGSSELLTLPVCGHQLHKLGRALEPLAV